MTKENDKKIMAAIVTMNNETVTVAANEIDQAVFKLGGAPLPGARYNVAVTMEAMSEAEFAAVQGRVRPVSEYKMTWTGKLADFATLPAGIFGLYLMMIGCAVFLDDRDFVPSFLKPLFSGYPQLNGIVLAAFGLAVFNKIQTVLQRFITYKEVQRKDS